MVTTKLATYHNFRMKIQRSCCKLQQKPNN